MATTTASALPATCFRPRQHDRRLLARHLLGPPFVVIVDAHESDSGGLRRHARVLAPEMADPDHRQANRSRPRSSSGAAHLMKPRSLERMNCTSSSTSGWPCSSSAIRSRAWLVLSFDLTRKR